MNGISLNAAEERQSRETLQHPHHVRQYRRSLAVLEFARGKPVHEVAQSLHVTRQSIYNWVMRFCHTGRCAALVDRPRTGRPSRADGTADTFLQELMGMQPTQCGYRATCWTVSLLQDQLRQHLNQVFCKETLRRVLHRLGYVWKRPRYVLAADEQREKKHYIRHVLGCLPHRSVVLAEDETDLLLFPPLRAMWSLRSLLAEVRLSGWNARRTALGCMNLTTGHRLVQVRHRQRAQDFQAFLHQVHRQYRGWHVPLLLDSDCSHTAIASQALAAKFGIQLLWLPKRAPELNPMDTLWGQGKDAICANKQYVSVDE